MGAAIDTYTSGQPSAASGTTGRAIDAFAQYEANKNYTKPVAQEASKPMKQQAQPAAQAQPKRSKSFLNKFVSGAKGFASAATTGEQKLSQGIARVLPGGSNDLSAEQKSATADQQAGQTYAKLYRQGKISKAQYQKATGQVASNANQTSADLTKTTKAMPTKAQIALGGASTAADVLTAGSLPEIKALSGASKLAKAGRVGTQLAANATAGGLNAAAGGGDKGTIIKNTAAGAALPELLGIAGHVAGKGVSKVADKVSTKPAKELITNVKTQNLLEQMAAKQGAKQAKTAVTDLPTLDLPAKHVPVAEPVATARPVEQIKTDIQANSDHVKTITGKNPNSFIETTPKGSTKIVEGTPKDIKPYIEQHQALQKEYVAATTPGKVTGASEAPTTPTATAAEKVTPESKSAIQPGLAKNEESVSPSNITPKASAVTEPTTTKAVVDPNAPPERGVSKVAQDIQTQAVKRGLKNDFGEAGGYTKINLEDQARKAVALANDRPALDKVISGETPLPDGLRATALIKAVENHPELGKDPEIIRKLSQAEHLTGESSRSAQELRLAAERNPTSPVEAARKVREARVAALEKKTGKTVNSHITKDVNAALAAKPKVTRQTWSEFITSIKC